MQSLYIALIPVCSCLCLHFHRAEARNPALLLLQKTEREDFSAWKPTASSHTGLQASLGRRALGAGLSSAAWAAAASTSGGGGRRSSGLLFAL